MRMTIIAALEKMAELNDYEEILIQDNASESTTIENMKENVQNFAEDPDEERDYYVTAEEIRVIDEDGYIKTGCEAIYKRVEEGE